INETYVKIKGHWAYLYLDLDSRGCTINFYLSSHRNSKAAYQFLRQTLNNLKKWQISRFIKTEKAPTYGHELALLKREGRCQPDVKHRKIKYRNNVIECDHGKLKRIISAARGFKTIKTAYATMKDIEGMPSVRKDLALLLYYGNLLDERYLISRVI
ncbi:MAG: DDE-type integrase/transposase/recombinase, partial [Serratia symbiotica]|nr:DDE-type integrase/transposase/recombinase [Serratia symbiotica]